MTIEFWIDAGKNILNNPKTSNVQRKDYSTVNRFQNINKSIEKYFSGDCICAIGFSSDTNLMIGGFGLFGGRSENIAKIKLFDIGIIFHEKTLEMENYLQLVMILPTNAKKEEYFPYFSKFL